MKLYIISKETGEHVATVSGESEESLHREYMDNPSYGSNDFEYSFSDIEENDDAEQLSA